MFALLEESTFWGSPSKTPYSATWEGGETGTGDLQPHIPCETIVRTPTKIISVSHLTLITLDVAIIF